jgi:hypothetical protein
MTFYLKNVIGVVLKKGEAETLNDFFNSIQKTSMAEETDYFIQNRKMEIVGVVKGRLLIWRMK